MEQRDGTGEDLIQNFVGKRVDLFAGSGLEVENPRLIAADDAGGADARDRDSEADAAGKLTSACNGQHNRRSGDLIELGGGDDENRTTALLLITGGRVERDEVDIAALHRSSRPTAGASIHSRSESGWVRE